MKARKTTREESLKTKLNASTERVPLVVTYNPALPNLHYSQRSSAYSTHIIQMPDHL